MGRDVVIEHKTVEPLRKVSERDRLCFPLRNERIGAARDDEDGGTQALYAQLRDLRMAVAGERAALRPLPRRFEIFE